MAPLDLLLVRLCVFEHSIRAPRGPASRSRLARCPPELQPDVIHFKIPAQAAKATAARSALAPEPKAGISAEMRARHTAVSDLRSPKDLAQGRRRSHDLIHRRACPLSHQKTQNVSVQMRIVRPVADNGGNRVDSDSGLS